MLVVHHLNNSRSQRILWLLEELGVTYEIKKYERTELQLAPKALLDINPLGKSPIITDGPITLAESGAIVDYLITKYGDGQPIPSDPGYMHNIYFSHYAEGSLMPILVQKIIFDYIPKHSPFFTRPLLHMVFGQLNKKLVQPELRKHISMIESHLETVQNGWFAGGTKPTAADYQMIFPLEGIASDDSSQTPPPRIMAYVQMVHARPAYQRAIQKGGEYAYAKL
ncbi:thioredoxin-like protein [Infundibulicybe gibba]|nr:thioredoxin-like protein [Infundibulicybe gibba]